MSNFNVKKGYMYYNNDLLQSHDRYPFHNYIFEKESIGGGGNGIVFKAWHVHLERDVAIKFYFPTIDKEKKKTIKNEIAKNSKSEIQSIVANYHDGGVIDCPVEIYYSAMDLLGDYTTIKKWLKNRDSLHQKVSTIKEDNNLKLSLLLKIKMETLNVSHGFINKCLHIFGKQITHGDLNTGNILVKNNLPELQDNQPLDWSVNNSISKKIRPGIFETTDVKLIDLGTSKAINTTKIYGYQRDSQLMLDIMRRLLKIFFNEQQSIKSILNIKTDDKNQAIRVKISNPLFKFTNKNNKNNIVEVEIFESYNELIAKNNSLVILKELFPNEFTDEAVQDSILNFVPIKIDFNQFQQNMADLFLADPFELASDLFTIVVFLNYLIGLIHSSLSKSIEPDPITMGALLSYTSGFLSIANFSSIYDSQINESINIINNHSILGHDGARIFTFIKWDKLINIIASNYPEEFKLIKPTLLNKIEKK